MVPKTMMGNDGACLADGAAAGRPWSDGSMRLGGLRHTPRASKLDVGLLPLAPEWIHLPSTGLLSI